MAIKAAMWVHGTIVEAEYPGPWVNISRKGWGTHFKAANCDNWLHIPITTPVILDDIRPKLGKIFVFYATFGDAKLTHLHIYDGKTKIKSFDGLTLSGDHSGAIDSSNSWVITPNIEIKYGLGISVRVQFGAFASVVPEIVIYTAGADFIRP